MSGNFPVPAGSNPLGEPSDAELVGRSRQGDRSAFDQLMQRHERGVISMAYRMLGQHEDAVELAQDVFCRAYRALPRFREEAGFRTWLYRITLNLVRNRRRWYVRHRVSQTFSLDEPAGGEEDDGEALKERIASPAADPRQETARAELRLKIQRALEELPAPFRAVVVMRDIENLPYEEIARICGERVGTIKSRLHRGRGMLRAVLKGVI